MRLFASPDVRYTSIKATARVSVSKFEANACKIVRRSSTRHACQARRLQIQFAMNTLCLFSAVLILQLPLAVTERNRRHYPPQAQDTTCAATTCGPNSTCRIVLNPTSKVVSPVCVGNSQLPRNGAGESCTTGEPLLLGSISKGRLNVVRCGKSKSCPAPGLVCNNGVCCQEDTPPPSPSSCDDLVCEPGFECVVKAMNVSCNIPACASDPIPCSFVCPKIAQLVATCEAVERSGECPAPGDGPCTRDCENDASCNGDEKCCQTACGGFTCSVPDPPPFTCATVDCLPDQTCIDTETGPECISIGQCSLPPETGPCRAAFTRYYYDPKVPGCKTFTYGGCGGNGNNFATLDACVSACARTYG